MQVYIVIQCTEKRRIAKAQPKLRWAHLKRHVRNVQGQARAFGTPVRVVEVDELKLGLRHRSRALELADIGAKPRDRFGLTSNM